MSACGIAHDRHTHMTTTPESPRNVRRLSSGMSASVISMATVDESTHAPITSSTFRAACLVIIGNHRRARLSHAGCSMPSGQPSSDYRQQHEPLEVSKCQCQQPLDPPRRRKRHPLDRHREIKSDACHRSCEKARRK